MKKKLLFTAYNLNIGGIETSLVNLLNNIDYSKYDVTLILERKEGILLNEINKNVIVKELKVSNFKISFIRKIINFIRKLLFSLKYKNKFDFSCCYATYSYSGNKLALIGSKNSSIYVHSNYKDLYKSDFKKFKEFFDSRNIDKFRNIIFVSFESRNDFLKYYPYLKDKTKVFNNFINVSKIINLSKETINEKKPNNILFVYVGRLDDSSKKLSRAIEIVKNIDEITLWMVGDGPDRAKYEKLVSDYDLKDRVLFIGEKKNPYPYIEKADYVILTSDYEGFPVIYLESLVLKKPIITTIGVSSDHLNINDYAYIISKNNKKMIDDVKKVLKSKTKYIEISIDNLQKERIKELENLFDSNYN